MMLNRLSLFFSLILATLSLAGASNDLLQIDAERSVIEDGLQQLLSKQQTESLDELERVLLKHFKVNAIVEAQSFNVKGAYITQGEELDLSILAKRPHFLKQDLKYRGTAIQVNGFDGERYWNVGPPLEDEPLMALNEDLLFLECHSQALLWGFEAYGLNGLKRLSSVSFQGRTCYCIENTKLLSAPMIHYIDVQSGVELGRMAKLKVGSETYEVLLVYDKATALPKDAPKIHGGYSLYLNDQLYAKAIFESVRLNSGLMPWSFRNPNE